MMKTTNLRRFATILFPSLLILLASASCSQKANRSEKSNAAYADSILVLVNGEEWPDFPQELLTDGYCMENDTIKGIFSYFADRNLKITSAVLWKGTKGEHAKEFYRQKYGERVNNGILDIGVEALVKSSDTDIDDPQGLVGYIYRRAPQEAIVQRKWNIYYDDTLRKAKIIGGLIPFSLAFINGERRTDFPEEDYGIDFFKAFTRSELAEILKKKNYVLDDVNILQDNYSPVLQKQYSLPDKYRQGGFVYPGTEQGIKAVYEIKAHPINQKGEIFLNVATELPQFPGPNIPEFSNENRGHFSRGIDTNLFRFYGDIEALMGFIDDNIRYTKKMVDSGVHGRVVVTCVIGKDGRVEEPEITRNLLRDKLSRPCTDSVLIRQCEDEALRVVGMMPRWKPSKNEKGKPVRVRVFIPVNF